MCGACRDVRRGDFDHWLRLGLWLGNPALEVLYVLALQFDQTLQILRASDVQLVRIEVGAGIAGGGESKDRIISAPLGRNVMIGSGSTGAVSLSSANENLRTSVLSVMRASLHAN